MELGDDGAPTGKSRGASYGASDLARGSVQKLV